MQINDLIYDRGAWKEIQDEFPDAKLEDASDYLHDGRFSVEMEADLEEYYFWLITSGWASCSLWFQLDLQRSKTENPERYEILECALARAEALKDATKEG